LRELHPLSATLSSLISSHGSMFQQGMSFRMDAFNRLHGFNASNRSCWDFELLCGLLANGKKAELRADRIAAFRLHDASLTGGSAGVRHQARYDIDRGRIIAEHGGKDHASPRLSRMIHKPAQLINRAVDVLMPSRLQKRFARDMDLG
jgi:hypothetical protein